MPRKAAPSTAAEIIALLVNDQLPFPFIHADVKRLLLHRSNGAISGSLSTLRSRSGILTVSPNKPKGHKYSLLPHITKKDLLSIRTCCEKIMPAGITRKRARSAPPPSTSELRQKRKQAEVVLERVLVQLCEIERILLTLEQECDLIGVETPRKLGVKK